MLDDKLKPEDIIKNALIIGNVDYETWKVRKSNTLRPINAAVAYALRNSGDYSLETIRDYMGVRDVSEVIGYLAQVGKVIEESGLTPKFTTESIKGDLERIVEGLNPKEFEMPKERSTSNYSPDEIINGVSSALNVRVSDLLGRSRVKYIATARNVLMTILRRETSLSLVSIGGYIGGRDHTTVLYANGKFDDFGYNPNLDIESNARKMFEHLGLKPSPTPFRVFSRRGAKKQESDEVEESNEERKRREEESAVKRRIEEVRSRKHFQP